MNNIKMALQGIKRSRWRSFMTMFGIIIGVTMIVTTVSLGEGFKKQVIGQINHIDQDVITIRPGRLVERDGAGAISDVNFFGGFGAASLSEKDLKVIEQVPEIKTVVPLNLISGKVQAGQRTLKDGFIIGTTERLPEVMHQKVEFGGFFQASDAEKPVAIIGKRVAEQLFNENVPVGKNITIRTQEFVVRGVFEEFFTTPLLPYTDFNSAIFIPYASAKKINNNGVQLYQILAEPKEPALLTTAFNNVQAALVKEHGGEEDFTVLRQFENVRLTSDALNIITRMVAGLAAISLLIGGIGIMNIMLVSVSERASEIGIRKAVGATNAQILRQFLVEAVILSLAGGLIGVLVSGLTNFGLRSFTELRPVITWPIVGFSLAASLLIGSVFGTMPALKASRKDPIEALRH